MSATKQAFDDLGYSPILSTSVSYQRGERQRAVRYIAGAAKDAADLQQLLDHLGLEPWEGLR